MMGEDAELRLGGAGLPVITTVVRLLCREMGVQDERLRRALSSYHGFLNGHRPHQGIGNRIPDQEANGKGLVEQACGESDQRLTVVCEQFTSTSLRAGLGGLLRSYSRRAA
jgi:hypothetical protein